GWSADGTKLVAGESAYGSNVRVWDMLSGNILRTFAGHPNGFVQGVAISPDGTKVVSGSGFSRDTAVCRVSDGAQLALYDQETGWGIEPELPMAWSPDGTKFGYGRTDATVDVATAP